MDPHSVRVEILSTLSRQFEQDSRQFVVIPQPMMQMCATRAALAELRNDGFIEEQVRGVVRLRPHGYMMLHKQPPDNSSR